MATEFSNLYLIPLMSFFSRKVLYKKENYDFEVFVSRSSVYT